MTPITRKNLSRVEGPFHVDIRSLEGGLYVADVKNQSQAFFLTNKDGSRVLSKSVNALLDTLKPFTIDQVQLIQDCAYDEMIGNTSVTGRTNIPVIN